MAERYAKLEDESTPLEVHTLRRIWAFVVRNNFLSRHYWQRPSKTIPSPISDGSSPSEPRQRGARPVVDAKGSRDEHKELSPKELSPEPALTSNSAPPALKPIPMSIFWSSQVSADIAKQEDFNKQYSSSQSLWAEIRATAGACVVSRPYRYFKLVGVLLSCAGLMLERPNVAAQERKALQFIYAVTTGVFLLDFCMRLVGLGIWHYLSSVYNILDCLALLALVWDQIAALSQAGGGLATGTSRLAVMRCFHVIGAPRLFFSASSTGMSHVMYLSLEQAVPRMLPTTLLVIGAFTGFSVLGQSILSGKMHMCSDPVIWSRHDCQGLDASGAPRSWDLPPFNFGWFGSAVLSLFFSPSLPVEPAVEFRSNCQQSLVATFSAI